MGIRRITTLWHHRWAAVLLLLAVTLALPTPAQADDTGLCVDLGVQKKLNKKASVSADAEFRSRNDFRTVDRISIGVAASYKLLKWLKMEGGYVLLIDNNPEKITLLDDGTTNTWRPSYWDTRHRFYAGLGASCRIGRIDFSLRERYQLTWRPEHTTTCYDFNIRQWEPDEVRAKTRHVLRSRLKIQYDIPASKFSPWASVELFNDLALDKTRLQAGCDYTIKKRHEFSLFYRYQMVNGTDEDGETNSHQIGAGYTIKF